MPATPKSLKLITSRSQKTGGVFTATLEWLLTVEVSDDVADMLSDAVAAQFASQLPIEGSPYPGYPFASCRTVGCDRIKGGQYRFRADYSDAGSTDRAQTNENPLLDLPKISATAGMISMARHRDMNGYAILNSAGDPIIDTVESNFIGFAISANVESVPSRVLQLRDTRNDGPIVVGGLPIAHAAARIILPANWISEQQARNDIAYRVFSFELHLDENDFHNGYPLDAGYRQLIENDELETIRVAIVNEDGSEPGQPVPLDGSGKVLIDPTPESSVHRETERYPLADYSWLPGVD